MTHTSQPLSPAQTGLCRLRLMGTTDLHAHLCAYDYYRDCPSDSVGLVRVASLIRQARAEVDNAVLLDTGDLLQGSPMGDLIANHLGNTFAKHPLVEAMNLIGYDAATLGNHDFDFGLDFLQASLRDANFPFVLANAVFQGSEESTEFLPPYTLLDRQIIAEDGSTHTIRIGILGLTTPQITRWNRSQLNGRIRTTGYLETARHYVPKMRAAGADVVVVLAHTGIALQDHNETDENVGHSLSQIDGVDALFTGHVHLVYPSQAFRALKGADLDRGLLNGCPTVMAGYWGSHLGIIDLELQRDGSNWRVVSAQATARPVAERRSNGELHPLVADDPDLSALASQPHKDTLTHIRRPIGYTTEPLHSYFSMITGSAYLHLVAEAKADFVRRKLAATMYANIPVLGTATPFKSGGRGGPDYFTEVPAGELTIRSVTDIYLYPNQMRGIKVTTAQLADWLERAAGVFCHVEPGAQDAVLLDENTPSYFFDVIHGISYQIDLSQPARYDLAGNLAHPGHKRITNIRYNGLPVTEGMTFIVATNNYRRDGGGAFLAAMQGDAVFQAAQDNRRVVLEYIAEREAVSPSPERKWSFAPMPGTTVLFSTGPRARNFARDIDGLDIEDLGDDARGFCVYRLHL